MYDANNTFWDNKQVYTDCLNDSSKHINLYACTRSELVNENTDLKQMWVNAEARDESYDELCQTIYEKQRSFSTVLKVRVFIMKCFLSDEEKLLFCERC